MNAETTNEATNQPTNEPEKPLFVYSEQCICLQCEATIPRENIAAKMHKSHAHAIEPTRQTVKAYCEHCNIFYQVTRELRGGMWTILGKVAVIDNPAAKAAFLKEIAPGRNEMQVA